MVDNHPSTRAKPKGKGVVIGHKSHGYHAFLPDWSDYSGTAHVCKLYYKTREISYSALYPRQQPWFNCDIHQEISLRYIANVVHKHLRVDAKVRQCITYLH